MAVTDGELSRTLNALAVTLTDQKATGFDRGRVQEIVTGTLGGEEKLSVHQGSPAGGFLVDAETGEQVAEVRLDGGAWQTTLWRDARSSRAYVPKPG